MHSLQKHCLLSTVALSLILFACGNGDKAEVDNKTENKYGKGDRTPVRVQVGQIDTWQTLIGEPTVSIHLSAIEQIENNEILAVGVYRRHEPPKESAYLARLDSQGKEIWNTLLGKSSAFWAADGVSAGDGGLVILGQLSPWRDGPDQIRNAIVFKIDESGKTVWETNITEGNDEELGAALVQTSDGGYLVSGQITSIDKSALSTFLAKLSPKGELLWKKVYRELGARMGIGLIPDAEGGCTATSLVTSTEPHANTDALIFKVDANGEVVWSKKIGGDDEDEVYSIAPTADGGYVIAGKTRSIGAGDYDMWIAKLDAEANMVWQNAFGTDRDEAGLSAAQTKDGNYIMVGTSRWYADGQLHMIGTKVDQQGNWMWEKVYKPGNLEQSRMVLPTNDGGAILAGSSRRERSNDLRMMIIKIDPNGEYKAGAEAKSGND